MKVPFKILFVSHEATRTGAPMILLHLVKWLKKNSDLEATFLLKDGGSLQNAFENIAPTFVWNSSDKNYLIQIILDRLYQRFFSNKYHPLQIKTLRKLANQKFDLIYLNTVATHDLLPILKTVIHAPVISHVHEMSFSINTCFPTAIQPNYLKLINHFIVVSDTARKVFEKHINHLNINISLFHEFIDSTTSKSPTIGGQTIKKQLALGNEFIVGCSGIGSWRKGIDIFITLSRMVQKQYPKELIRFIWVGDVNQEIIAGYKYENDILGLETNLIFTGVQTEPQNYFNIFDLYVLTSREDPFPLTCIEAAVLGKPIICFEGVSGIPELIGIEGGIVVPYLDLELIVENILKLSKNKEELLTMGAIVRKRAAMFDVSNIAPKIHEVINGVIGIKL